MENQKLAVMITAAEWQAKQTRGQVAMIDNRPFILLGDSGAPVYQPVVIVEPGTQL